MAIREAPADVDKIEAAFLAIAAHGVAGLVWLDEALIAVRTLGSLASFVRLNRKVSDSVLALVDSDAEIAGLTLAPDSLFHLPAVTIQTKDGPTPRLDLYLFRLAGLHDGHAASLLVLLPAVEAADSAPELTRQMRARLIAEGELALAKRNLEEFAGILAHDLGAPMRTMRYLAGDLAGRLKGSGDGEAIALVEALDVQSRRLSQMMSALLDYASVGRLADQVANVDTGALARAVVDSSPHGPGMRIVLEGEWPRIDTLAAPLDLVLRNLVDNAVKHHDRASGEVRVSAECRETALVITVADDGAGIAPAHHAAIFLPFRTLADTGRKARGSAGTRSTLAGKAGSPLAGGTGSPLAGGTGMPLAGGTGMGLAFVRRAVEAVGGTLTIASDPALRRGTTFRLAWPMRITASLLLP